ncbi:MAG: SPOR domain-containing protein, partial [Tangfeifania sp.]
LEKIGELQYDDNHNIQFNPFKGENLLLDAYGLGAVPSLKENHEGTVEVPDAKGDENEPGVVAAIEGFPPEKESVEKDPPSRGVKEPEPTAEEKKKRGWLWFLLILLPLIVAGIFMIRKNNEEKLRVAEVNKRPAITDNAPDEAGSVPAITDSIRSDTVKLAVAKDSAKAVQQDTAIFSEDEESIDSAKYVESDPSKYYLVAGSFKKKKNADKFFTELEDERLNPFHLGKHGNFYIVGLGEYESEQQAFRAQDKFLEKHPESGVWVYQIE